MRKKMDREREREQKKIKIIVPQHACPAWDEHEDAMRVLEQVVPRTNQGRGLAPLRSSAGY